MNNETQGNTQELLADACEGDCKQESVHTPQTQAQTQDTGEQTTDAPDAEAQRKQEREERFHALMEGEFKDLFTAYFQETFNRRFKEHKTIQGELNRARAVVAAAEERFGTRVHGELLTAIRAEKSTVAPTETEGAAPHSTQSVEEIRAMARQELMDSIRARGMRPTEGGLQTTSAVAGGAGRLTRSEREELARRAARGERIIF